jgi:hypothetical protein
MKVCVQRCKLFRRDSSMSAKLKTDLMRLSAPVIHTRPVFYGSNAHVLTRGANRCSPSSSSRSSTACCAALGFVKHSAPVLYRPDDGRADQSSVRACVRRRSKFRCARIVMRFPLAVGLNLVCRRCAGSPIQQRVAPRSCTSASGATGTAAAATATDKQRHSGTAGGGACECCTADAHGQHSSDSRPTAGLAAGRRASGAVCASRVPPSSWKAGMAAVCGILEEARGERGRHLPRVGGHFRDESDHGPIRLCHGSEPRGARAGVALSERFTRRHQTDVSNPHTVAGLLKMWLRQNPVFPKVIMGRWCIHVTCASQICACAVVAQRLSCGPAQRVD